MRISDFEHRARVLVHKIGDHGFSSINAMDIVRKASFRAYFFDLADNRGLNSTLPWSSNIFSKRSILAVCSGSKNGPAT